jgi:phosphoribosylaminoimidazole carboxylase (NCAIR synthetase)
MFITYRDFEMSIPDKVSRSAKTIRPCQTARRVLHIAQNVLGKKLSCIRHGFLSPNFCMLKTSRSYKAVAEIDLPCVLKRRFRL